jgi:hypothetical protein
MVGRLMRALPILFSGPMIRAILREIKQPGTGKTQTRRALTKARVFAAPDRPAFTLKGDDMARALQNADRFRHLADFPSEDAWFWESDAFEWQAPAKRTGWMAHIGYGAGDLRYVREAWETTRAYDDLKPSEMGGDEPIRFQSDDSVQEWGWPAPRDTDWGRGRPGMFMPRWASRITLTVTDVRVQRLQEISEEDARAEGIEGDPVNAWRCYQPEPKSQTHWLDPRESFRTLWDSINGDRPGLAWKYNPWVAAISFRPHLINIDNLLERTA